MFQIQAVQLFQEHTHFIVYQLHETMGLTIGNSRIRSVVMLIDRFSCVSAEHQVSDMMLFKFRQEYISEEAGITDGFDTRCHTKRIVVLLCKRQCLIHDVLMLFW